MSPDRSELDEHLAALARVPQLLVACDYDGTIAPIVDDPMQAHPRRETVVALRSLASLPQTEVAVISSRSLRDLAALSRLPTEIHLVGSHGSEFDIGFRRELAPEMHAVRDDLRGALLTLAAEVPGSFVEAKPAAVAFHYRAVEEKDALAAIERIEGIAADRPDVSLRHGSKVAELTLLETDKGQALEHIRHQVGAKAVIFLGDAVTDEDAFATLSGPDVGIKVGPEPTAADFRVDDTAAVSQVLARLCELRQEWLAGSAAVPIAAHSVLSDQRTAALVTPDGRITWMCVPRIDSAAIFAEMLGGPTAGHFSVRPSGGAAPTGQRYMGDTMRVETRWSRMTVTDYLDCSGGRPSRLAGRSDLIRVVEGTGTAVVEFAPRLDFGRSSTHLERHEEGLEIIGSSDLLALRAPGVEWHIVDEGQHQTARAELDLDRGPWVLEFRCGTANLRADASTETERREATDRFWSGWAEHLIECPVAPDLVRRSALTLKSLCYGPTGAIVAAATTSLPEHLGGVRNWDYRYCWLRDAALSAAALVRLGSHDEAMEFLDWVLHLLDERDPNDRIHPLYSVTGRHLPPEAEITELAGYAGSRPVRIGNAADRQVQLDVSGPVADLVCVLAEQDVPLSGRHWQVLEALVAAVAARWHEPDHGIWEIRKQPRHHVYSKVMCWVVVDRAIKVADRFVNRLDAEWPVLRDTIAADVLEHGYKESVGAFTAAYDGEDADAASLAIGTSGLLAPDDPRFLGTIDLVESELRDGPTIYRYLHDDGLPGSEGGFHLMTSWLIDAYHLAGRTEDARDLFDGLVGLVGPTGLLSEEWDPATGRSLGNHPQAYSHLGLVNNALHLAGH
jgi:trehalose 6-phosphate phosphatase